MSENEHLTPRGEPLPGVERVMLPASPARPPSSLARPRVPRSRESEEGTSVRFVLNSLRRWWLLATPLALLLAAAGGGVVYLLFKPEYEAAAWMQIEERTPSLLDFTRFEDRSKTFVQTQIQLIHSPLVMGPVLSQPEVANVAELQGQADKIEWLAKRVKIAAQGESELFKMSFAAYRPEDAAAVVNAVVDQYFKLRGDEEKERKDKIVHALQGQQKKRQDDVKTLLDELRRATEKVPVTLRSATRTDPDASTTRALADLQTQLTFAEWQCDDLKARVTAEEGLSITAPEAAIAGAVDHDNAVQAMKATIAEKRRKQRTIESQSAQGDKAPAFTRLAEEIRRDEQSLEELKKEVRPKVKAEMESAMAGTQASEVAKLKRQLADSIAKTEWLRKRSGEQLRDLGKFTSETLEIEIKKEEWGARRGCSR